MIPNLYMLIGGAALSFALGLGSGYSFRGIIADRDIAELKTQIQAAQLTAQANAQRSADEYAMLANAARTQSRVLREQAQGAANGSNLGSCSLSTDARRVLDTAATAANGNTGHSTDATRPPSSIFRRRSDGA
jgi:cell division septum initiation protein DivIVA